MRYAMLGFLLVSAIGEAHGQSYEMLREGKALMPSDNVTIYNAPPNAFLKRQIPTGILNPTKDAIRIFPLTPTDNGFLVQEPTDPLEAVIITDHIDILQNGVLERWLRLSDDTSKSSDLGWTVCKGGEANCTALTRPEETDP